MSPVSGYGGVAMMNKNVNLFIRPVLGLFLVSILVKQLENQKAKTENAKN